MKILYLTQNVEDCLADGVLYGLRMKYGPDVVDFPKKESVYVGNKDMVTYGGGFTLWGNLPDLNIDRAHIQEKMEQNYFDLVIFSDIFRLQEAFTHWNVYLMLHHFKVAGGKFAFLDGSDDGKPTVYDALKWGTYFKRDNPNNYDGIKIIGLCIPEKKILTKRPTKTKDFARYCQVPEAYEVPQIKAECSKERFTSEEEYYADLATSRYGLGMKKSGWDTPRFMEYAANWCVPCIYTKGWEWDKKTWYDKPEETHPLGLVDMENCILWDTPQQLEEKIASVKDYVKLSRAAHDWVLTKTCEKTAEYIIKNI